MVHPCAGLHLHHMVQLAVQAAADSGSLYTPLQRMGLDNWWLPLRQCAQVSPQGGEILEVFEQRKRRAS